MTDMKKLLTIVAFAIAALPLAAQETYENAKIISEDLNGTARYVGMGGAMEALGADISTIGTNPAGIGLFRRSNISLSVGLVSQQDVDNVLGANKTNVSFDQAGFVWASRSDRSSFINRPLTDQDVIYDLGGRRVLHPTKGLYIVNGRKVLIQ